MRVFYAIISAIFLNCALINIYSQGEYALVQRSCEAIYPDQDCIELCIAVPYCVGILVIDSKCLLLNATGTQNYPNAFLMLRGTGASAYQMENCRGYNNESSTTPAVYTCPLSRSTEYSCGAAWFKVRIAPNTKCAPTCAYCIADTRACYTIRSADDMATAQIMMSRYDPASLAWTGVIYDSTKPAASRWLTNCTGTKNYTAWLGADLQLARQNDPTTTLWCHAINFTHSLFVPCTKTSLEYKICYSKQ
ncbi:unnamed protein product, partial [Mesorhabditis spiculigera]